MRAIALPGVIFVISLCCLLSCGLEAFYYIDYIPASNINATISATINLPSSSREGYSTYFSNFIIFYRIYISASPREDEIKNANEMADISQALSSDYSSFFPLTDITSTNANTSNLENTFYNRGYYKLELKGANIDSVLDNDSLGETLVIFFRPNPGQNPILTLNGVDYILQRATEKPGHKFNPKPQATDLYRTFFNHQELYNNANANNETNADTAPNARQNAIFTYVSMYIAARGRSLEMPPQNIYSQPTHVGIFKLADS